MNIKAIIKHVLLLFVLIALVISYVIFFVGVAYAESPDFYMGFEKFEYVDLCIRIVKSYKSFYRHHPHSTFMMVSDIKNLSSRDTELIRAAYINILHKLPDKEISSFELRWLLYYNRKLESPLFIEIYNAAIYKAKL